MVLRFRKKKMKESDNVEAQLLKVLEMVGSINWQEEQGLLMESLKKGKDMLKSMHEQMSGEEGWSEGWSEATANAIYCIAQGLTTYCLSLRSSPSLVPHLCLLPTFACSPPLLAPHLCSLLLLSQFPTSLI